MKQAYGFSSDPDKTLHQNAQQALGDMPIWYYFARPTNLAYHDLTSTIKPPLGLPKLLGLGSKFIPTPRYSQTWKQIEVPTYDRFDRSLKVKAFCIGHMDKPEPIPTELYQPGRRTSPGPSCPTQRGLQPQDV
jgi:hypothetical protein